MIWTQPKWIRPVQNSWYLTKMIWMVQNHFGPIEGQGINVLKKQFPSHVIKRAGVLYGWSLYIPCSKMALVPSPSAEPKFVLGILKFLCIPKFFEYIQNVLSALKWANLCSKISLLSVPKTFWVYFKNWVCLKNLSVLKIYFELADGLGIREVGVSFPCHALEKKGKK